MPKFISFGEIIEKNGKTIRENNLAINHKIPLGTLVEVKFDNWHSGGSCTKIHARWYVNRHTRDCDGSPLYSVGPYNFPTDKDYHGFGEDSLKIVEVTPEVLSGDDVLAWEVK